jgi:hypothetical protein
MDMTKPRTVSELMDVASKFVDGEDAYHNKRTRSPEDDRPHQYNNQSVGLETLTITIPIAK